MRAARAATHKPPAPPSIILHVFNRLLTALAALSFALAIAAGIVCFVYYVNAPADDRQFISHYRNDWRIVRGNTTCELSLTRDGFEFAFTSLRSPYYAFTIIEYYYSAVVLFLIVPVAWLIPWRKVHASFVDTADKQPVVIYPHPRQRAFVSLAVGILGFPIYIALLDVFAGSVGALPLEAAIPIFLLFFFGFPLGCVAFAFEGQSCWRGSRVGHLGALLTVFWFVLWIDLFLAIPLLNF
jgi:hypothetical protein